MTSTYFWDFLARPPSLYAKYIRFVRKFDAFLDPPRPPLSADVIYGVAHFDRNLPRNKKGRAPNPVVTLQVSGENVQSTEPVLCNHNPVFEQEFVFRVTSTLSDNLTLKVLIYHECASVMHIFDS